VLTLVLHTVFSYRALPVTAPKVTRRALVAAMNEMFAKRSPKRFTLTAGTTRATVRGFETEHLLIDLD